MDGERGRLFRPDLSMTVEFCDKAYGIGGLSCITSLRLFWVANGRPLFTTDQTWLYLECYVSKPSNRPLAMRVYFNGSYLWHFAPVLYMVI